jgi:hypothetical protein
MKRELGFSASQGVAYPKTFSGKNFGPKKAQRLKMEFSHTI